MKTQRERFEAFFQRRRPREPQHEAEFLVVADAYDTIESSGTLHLDRLNEIVAGASNPRALVWQNAVELLGHLTEQWTEASDAVVEMSVSKSSHVRFNAICCLTRKTPEQAVITVLTKGLTDKSSRVRWKAAQEAMTLEKFELVPQIDLALQAEKNANARSNMEFCFLLLRDGYILKSSPGGGFNLTVRTRSGSSGQFISDEELRSRGIDAIVAEIQERKKDFPIAMTDHFERDDE